MGESNTVKPDITVQLCLDWEERIFICFLIKVITSNNNPLILENKKKPPFVNTGKVLACLGICNNVKTKCSRSEWNSKGNASSLQANSADNKKFPTRKIITIKQLLTNVKKLNKCNVLNNEGIFGLANRIKVSFQRNLLDPWNWHFQQQNERRMRR